jgi:predicted RND superfamily exporter protein
MRLLTNHPWLAGLDWIAARPRAAAITATAGIVLVATLIRSPVIEGTMVDQMSDVAGQLQVSRQIQAASGGLTTAAVITLPGEHSISSVFADLALLRASLSALGDRIDVRAIDSAREQLFVYDFSGDEPVQRLLEVLRDNAETTIIVSADAASSLVVLSFPERQEQAVLSVLTAHPWSGVYSEHHILASAQLENDIASALMKDLQLLIPVIVVTMLLALFSILVTFALFSVAGITINLVTLLALPIVLIVGLANSCHFVACAGTAIEQSGNAAVAVTTTMRRVGPPFFFSSLTTAAALASLGFNDIQPIANLGRLSAAALLIVFALVMLAAPLSLRWNLAAYSRTWQESAVFAGLSAKLVTWRTQVSVLLLLVMLAGAATVPFLSVNSDPRSFFPDNAPFSAAQKTFAREFHVFSPLRALVTVDPASGNALQALKQAGRLRAALAEHPGVRQVTLMPSENDETAYVLTALLADEDSLVSVTGRIDAWRASMGADVGVIYSSASMVYNDIDRRATSSLLQSLGWSVALIFGAILLVFRSLRTLLGAMLANAVPLMLVCGVVWLVGKPLNVVTVFVFLVALGVIVDDAIHILFLRTAGDALAGSSIEFSVLLSTAMLCLGLLLCQISDFPTTREFAAYCAVALVAAVISNLTVLPFTLIRRRGSRPSTRSFR